MTTLAERRIARSRATNVYHHINGNTVIRYRNTDVVMFNDNEITLDSGGHYTLTTKRRMNQASIAYSLGYSVYQKDSAWYVRYKGQVIKFTNNLLTLKR